MAVRLSAEPDGLYVEAASADHLSVRKRVEHAVVQEEGQAVVLPGRLADWLGQPGDAICMLETRGPELACGRGEGDCFTLVTFDETHLSRVDAEFVNPAMTVEGAAVSRAIDHVLVAVDQKTDVIFASQPGRGWVGNGVVMHAACGLLHLEGSDGVAVCRSSCECDLAKEVRVLLSYPMARLVAGVAKGGPIEVGVRTGGAVWFRGDGWCVSGPPLAGNGPPIGEIIRRHDGMPSHVATVEAGDVTRAIAATMLAADSADRSPSVVLTLDAGTLSISCRGTDTQARRMVPCLYAGPRVEMRHSGGHLKRLFSEFDKADEVTLQVTGSESLMGILTDGGGKKYYLMPRTLKGGVT